jgi:type VI protein secretion system component VasK
MFAACMSLCKGELKRHIRSMTVTAVLALAAIAVVLVALGFALSLLYVWLQQIYGTMPALAIIAGGCAVLALILLSVAFRRKAHWAAPTPHAVPPSDLDAARDAVAASQRTIDESIAAVQQGSRESMLAAISMALVMGIILGRKL